LEVKSEAIAAYEACGEQAPGQAVELLGSAREFLAKPSLAGVEEVMSWATGWRTPVLEHWLQEATDDQIEIVAQLLGREMALDADLLDWLGGHASVRAVEIIQSYLSTATDRERIKEAKRALHRLKSKGLEVSLQGDKQENAAFSLALESHAPGSAQAYVTSVDGQGSQLLWVLWPSASGGNRLLQAVVEELAGLARAELVRVSKNEFRAHLERLRSNPALLVGRIELEAAAAQLVGAAARAEAQGAELPRAYEEWLEMAAASGVSVEPPPDDARARIYERIDVREVDGRGDLIDAAMELLREPYFSSWAVTGEAVVRAVGDIREAERSTIMINDEQRQARMQDALRSAVAESFDDPARRLYRRRLESMADMLWDEQGEAAARSALAAAVGFTEIGDLFEHHAFARALVHRGVWLLYQEMARKDAAEEKRTGVIRP
jgi:hypothetical protein